MTAKYPKIVGFQLIDEIGGGSFSTVFRAVRMDTHEVAACKMIAITEKTTEKDRKTINKEMHVHAVLKHSNVLEFMNAVVVELEHKHRYFPGIYMLLEFASGGDLFDKIAPDVGISEDAAHLYFTQLVAGIEYIHDQGVCHRDLKPENLLLDATGVLKISDFGLSAVYKLKETGQTRLLSEQCGSLPYIAPELHTGASYRAEPIDIWGMGVILFTLLAGNTPWDEPTDHSSEFRRYVSGRIFQQDPWNRLGESALSLIRGILTIDPGRRMTLAEIVNHPWCMRPSQLARQGIVALAEQLTQGLKETGDLAYANPDLTSTDDSRRDADGDVIMSSAGYHSQFTQSLMLFSQTQSGKKYTPSLTRFYASLKPAFLVSLIEEALTSFHVKFRAIAVPSDRDGAVRLRVGGVDQRKVKLRGWIEMEPFTYGEMEGTFCVMQRDEGDPISWRRLWKALVTCPTMAGHVLRK